MPSLARRLFPCRLCYIVPQMNRSATPASAAQRATPATLAGVGAIGLWCFSGVCYAVGSRAVGAMAYLALASAVGVLTIVILRVLRGGKPSELFRLPGRVMLAGFFGVAVYSVLLGGAMGMAEKRDLGHVMLLNYLWPIWILLLSLMMLDIRVSVWLVLIGALLGFGGVILATGIGSLRHRPASLWPHGMALLAGLLWAMYSVLLKKWEIPLERGGSTFHFTICAILSAAIGVGNGEWPGIHQFNAWAIFWVLLAGIGPVGLAYYWWEIGIKRGNVHLIALLAYFIPIASTALIGLFFHEAMTPALLPGAGMIAAGAYLGHRATINISNQRALG